MSKEIQKINYTSAYLALLRKLGKIREITGGGTPIQTITFSDSPINLIENKPKLIYDKFEKEDDLVKSDIKVITDSLKKVRELDIEIVSSKIKKRWKKGQSVEYKLKKIEQITEKDLIINQIPSGHEVWWDIANSRAKLIGNNCRNSLEIFGETDWIFLKKNTEKKDYKKTPEEYWVKMFGSPEVFLKDRDRKSIQQITDIPIMVGLDGTIICIPHRHEPNNIVVVGKKGVGKSLLLHRISDEIFSLWKESPIIMNDIQQECFIWNESLKNDLWINQLLEIDEKPLASPIIYVYPNTDTLELDWERLKQKINFIQTTIPFEEVIKNADVYLRLQEKGTLRYVLGIRNKLLNCETTEEIKELIETEFSGNVMRGMRDKMWVSFNNIFNEQILNITNPEYPYEITETLNDITGNPFVILAKVGLIPCFETYDLFNKRYMPEVIAYHLNSIFKEKYPGKLLENKTVYILFDELTQICDDNHVNSAHQSLCTIATRGRKMGLAIIGATQNYSKIPRKIKSNIDYVFAFKHSNEDEVNQIKKDFDLKTIEKEEIMNLEDFEIMAITNQYFVCYYKDKKWIPEEKVIKGRLIPPTSDHFHQN